MRTDPLTSHAAQVLARMRQQKRDDRAEAHALRLAIAPVTRATFYPPLSTVRVYQEA